MKDYLETLRERLQGLDTSSVADDGDDVFWDERRELRPALDIHGDIAFVTIPLDKRAPGRAHASPFLISNVSRDKRELTTDLVKQLGMFIRRDPNEYLLIPRDRWRGVRRFLKDGVEPTSAQQVFDGVRASLGQYVEFIAPLDLEIVALWTMGTYFHPMFDRYPYVYAGGLKGSGKTTLLRAVEQLAFNGRLFANISEASLFRTVDCVQPTCLIDEAEGLSRKNEMQSFRSLLNSGYTKGSKVQRTLQGKRDWTVNEYDVYSPKMFAAIAEPEPVLRSRCIGVSLLPTRDRSIGGRSIDAGREEFVKARDALYNYLMGQGVSQVRRAYQELDSSLTSRDADVWNPLLAIASLVSNELRSEIEEQAHNRTQASAVVSSSDSIEARTALALSELVQADGWVRPNDVSAHLNQSAEPESQVFPWRIGKALKSLSFDQLQVRRRGQGVEYFITPGMVKDRLERLGLSDEEREGEAVAI